MVRMTEAKWIVFALPRATATSEGGVGYRFLIVSAGRRRPDEDLAKKTVADASVPPGRRPPRRRSRAHPTHP